MNKNKVEILSHRGYWEKSNEKNTLKSFSKAFKEGFGIETDLRDCDGEIVVSHDPPIKKEDEIFSFKELLDLYKESKSSGFLALNIKSDGIYEEVKYFLNIYEINNYFTFDMSVPDLMKYLEFNIKTFCRYSEFENPLYLKDKVNGLWLDSFSQSNFDDLKLNEFIKTWDSIAIVSPELHGLDNKRIWSQLKKFKDRGRNIKLFLCTDKPAEARSYFN